MQAQRLPTQVVRDVISPRQVSHGVPGGGIRTGVEVFRRQADAAVSHDQVGRKGCQVGQQGHPGRAVRLRTIRMGPNLKPVAAAVRQALQQSGDPRIGLEQAQPSGLRQRPAKLDSLLCEILGQFISLGTGLEEGALRPARSILEQRRHSPPAGLLGLGFDPAEDPTEVSAEHVLAGGGQTAGEVQTQDAQAVTGEPLLKVPVSILERSERLLGGVQQQDEPPAAIQDAVGHREARAFQQAQDEGLGEGRDVEGLGPVRLGDAAAAFRRQGEDEVLDAFEAAHDKAELRQFPITDRGFLQVAPPLMVGVHCGGNCRGDSTVIVQGYVRSVHGRCRNQRQESLGEPGGRLNSHGSREVAQIGRCAPVCQRLGKRLPCAFHVAGIDRSRRDQGLAAPHLAGDVSGQSHRQHILSASQAQPGEDRLKGDLAERRWGALRIVGPAVMAAGEAVRFSDDPFVRLARPVVLSRQALDKRLVETPRQVVAEVLQEVAGPEDVSARRPALGVARAEHLFHAPRLVAQRTVTPLKKLPHVMEKPGYRHLA